jgi:hypothetical protein
VSFGAIPLNNSPVSTAHDKALAFIKTSFQLTVQNII